MSQQTMTLAFAVESLEPLADPAAVFEDAREWSTYVGVVSDQMAYQVINYLREQGIYEEDFFSRADKQQGLIRAADRTDTDRYVFVGCSAEDERIADDSGWEYLAIEEAAEKAGWELASSRVQSSA